MRRPSRTCHAAWLVLLAAAAGRAQPPAEGLPRPALLPPPAGAEAPRFPFLDRPLESEPPAPDFVPMPDGGPPLRYPFDPPLGFTGPSGVLPRDVQGDGDFVPVEDRWRIGLPAWDRYGNGHPPLDDYPYDLGTFFNPYKQNVLKGDYPIIGQHTFLNVTGLSLTLIDTRQVPTGTTPFESTARPREEEFFGSPNQLVTNQFLFLTVDLFHGDASFKPIDWRFLLTPAFNVNTLNVDELAVVNPDVRKGTQRDRDFFTLQEYFVEAKLADLSPNYDFVSLRVGSQPFISDFRAFLFSDVNRAVRLFGTAFSNRDQFNLAFFRQAEKDTNSGLNTIQDRGQDIVLANYYRQDFIFPGYTVQASLTYNHDPASFKFDRNNFLVRPDPVGTFAPHTLDVGYVGLAGDGHIGRYNITHQFYWAFGHDSQNPLANQAQSISAQMAAVELSYDRDWARFRTSFFYSSGDRNINNGHATGFDSILDNPNFAGGQFTYFEREAIGLFGANLTNRLTLIPDLRASKTQSQSNFVNPGLLLYNIGFDADLTPKLKMINNCNFLWFDSVEVLRQFTFDRGIDSRIGTDISSGYEYRPLLSNNVVMVFGVATLIPGGGFKSLFDRKDNSVNPPISAFVQMNLAF
jgi:hypothetical protein